MAMATMSTAMADLACLSSDSSFSAAATDADASSNAASSLSSTPPTTVSPDSMSLASDPDISKPDSIATPILEAAIPLLQDAHPNAAPPQSPEPQASIVVASGPPPAESEPEPEHASTSRPRRARASVPIYNVAELSGAVRRRSRAGTIESPAVAAASAGPVEANQAVKDGIDALDLNWSISGPSTPRSARAAKKAKPTPASAPITRKITRQSGLAPESLTTKLAGLGKRGKKNISRLSRELMRLQDTNEFAHVDTRPVRYTVWSNGKYVDPTESATPEPSRAKTKTTGTPAREEKEAAPETPAVEPPANKKRPKKWLEKGLYAGQEPPSDPTKGLTTQEKKKLSSLPELAGYGKPNSVLPLPMYNGLRLLINGRDFKLPFDICNPLPPGQPKPAAYRTMTKNRFVGDAAAYWKKTPHFGDFASKCVCKPEDGCAEDCQNRIMLYECDQTNCNVGKEFCTNRAFQDLQERTKKGGRYRVGVEVYKTEDRGYGVRSNRCFEANQIIMEYTGEIITEEECERRMNEEYKNNECYYLMSFDQNMIIDATTGSIARFVNHSCSPNCRMIKWIVSGQPRMALFAGDRPITTGEELTYDYNFDPFSAKNVQKCLCGSANCRGVLGPKPKEAKAPKPPKKDEKKVAKGSVKSSVAGTIKAGKRKLQELLTGDDEGEAQETQATKKRKIAVTTGLKRSISTGSFKGAAKGAARGAATAIRRSVSTISLGAKAFGAAREGKLGKTAAKKVQIKGKVASPATIKTLKRSSITILSSNSANSTPNKRIVAKRSARSTPSLSKVWKEPEDEDESSSPESTINASGGRPRTPLVLGSPRARNGIDIPRVDPEIRIVNSPE